MIPTLVRGRRNARLLALFVGALFAADAAALQQAAPRPQLYVVKDVRLVDKPDAPRVSIVLRDGRIEAVLAGDAPPPLGAREVDGKGMLALPAFVDAYTQAGCATPTPEPTKDKPLAEIADVQVDMRDANRKGIQPAFRAAEVFALPTDKSKPWRESGFGALLSAPAGQLLAGTSALATTRDAAMRDTILVADVFAHAAFRAGGPGYPSTLMGYYAQLRQFFLDVRHQAELQARYAAGKSGPRPPFDAELEAGLALAGKQRRVMCEADGEQDIRRWISFGDELGIDIGIVGGREAWKVADVLKARAIPVVLTLQWGDEPKDPHEKDKKAKPDAQPDAKPEAGADKPPSDASAPPESKPADAKPAEQKAGEQKSDDAQADAKKAADKQADDKKKWEYEEPLGVREDKRREWTDGRDCAVLLNKAGVPFCFGSGSDNAADLLKKVRTLVENGLPHEVALDALTVGAAKLIGADKHLGSLRVGADASLGLWSANPMTKDAKLAWLFVDGFANEFELDAEARPEGKPDDGVDASGTWAIESKTDQGSRPGTLEIAMTPNGEATGTLTTKTQGGDERVVELKGYVIGKTLTLEGSFTMRNSDVTAKWKLELDGDALSGTSTTKGPWGESESTVSGSRKPKHEATQVDDGERCDEEG